MLNENINKNNTNKIYLIIYEDEIDDVCGAQQFKEFTQYRIEVEKESLDQNLEESKFQYKDLNNLTEKECLDILQIDGYKVQIFETY